MNRNITIDNLEQNKNKITFRVIKIIDTWKLDQWKFVSLKIRINEKLYFFHNIIFLLK